jgi:hypothetical protein
MRHRARNGVSARRPFRPRFSLKSLQEPEAEHDIYDDEPTGGIMTELLKAWQADTASACLTGNLQTV